MTSIPPPTEFPDSDVITIPRPRSLLRMTVDLIIQRNRRLTSQDRNGTLVDAAQVLSDSGRAAQVISRDPVGGEWSVTFGPASPPPPEPA